jgi:hypothetical protein
MHKAKGWLAPVVCFSHSTYMLTVCCTQGGQSDNCWVPTELVPCCDKLQDREVSGQHIIKGVVVHHSYGPEALQYPHTWGVLLCANCTQTYN